MALTLRDSHSYETQIIDAVRGVNRALGGTYGTSSAIHKSEFNQYEVQLIDAIKGIGRTLSGNGLSLAGGGASSKELQDLAKRVTKLESESFFRLVSGNVTLKEQYQNLWVPGWLAAGGIGTGGGGGGVSYLRQLEDVFHNDSGILRGDGDPVEDGDIIVYDETSGMWAAAANSPAGAVTNYGDTTTGRIAKVGTVDIYNGVKWGSAGSEANTFTLTVNGVTKTVALQGYGGGGGGGAYALGTLTTASATKGTMLGVNAISNDLASTGSESSLIEWDSTNSAWHFLGNIYSDGWIAAGGTGTPGGGGGGVDLSEVWNSLTNTVADQWATTKIDLAHIPNITASMVSDLGTWASSNLYTLRTHVSTTAANGTLLGVDALSNASSSVSGSDSTRIEWDNDHNAWRVRGNLYADGWVAAGGIGSGGGGATSLNDLTDVTLSSPSDGQFLIYDGTNQYWKNASLPIASASTLGGIKVGNNLSIDANGVLSSTGGGASYLGQLQDVDVQETYAYDGYVLTYQHSNRSYILTAKSGGGGGSTVSWGTTYSDYTVDLTVDGVTKNICLDGYNSGGGGGGSTVSVTALVSTGTKIATITVDGVGTDLYAPSSGGGGGSTVNWGTGNDYYAPLTVDNVTKNVLIGTDYVTLSTTQTIIGAKTFTTNPVTIGSTSSLSVDQNSYIDIGPLRIKYDATNKALRITKASSSDNNNYGIYADGFVAAGGIA